MNIKEDDVLAYKVWGTIILIALVSGFLFWKFVLTTWEAKKERFNQNVIPILQSIEKDCMDYVFKDYVSQETLAMCKDVVEYGKSCYQNPNGCAWEDYYETYRKLGFTLPPLYNSPTPKPN